MDLHGNKLCNCFHQDGGCQCLNDDSPAAKNIWRALLFIFLTARQNSVSQCFFPSLLDDFLHVFNLANYNLYHQTTVLPRHADGAQGQRQRDVLRPVGHDGNEVGPITDRVGSPASTTDNVASYRKCRVFALEHSVERAAEICQWSQAGLKFMYLGVWYPGRPHNIRTCG